MKIEDVQHLATLSRIALTDEELSAYAAEMDSILEYVDHVKKLSLGEREAVVPPHPNPLREDVPTHAPGTYSVDIIAAFPKSVGRHALVKRILGNSHDPA
jgi:aspartyl-tRNA(Asn)/glutamyl-tRNA(Gln) amidotransferase subunit C